MLSQFVGRLKSASKNLLGLRPNAFDLLRSDHMKLEGMLVKLRLLKDPGRRNALLARIHESLLQHASLEENILYPACERAGMEKEMAHVRSDHELAKLVVDDLGVIDPSTTRYNELLTQLIIKLEHHVHEEEDEIFPLALRRMSRGEFRQVSREIVAAHQAAEAAAAGTGTRRAA